MILLRYASHVEVWSLGRSKSDEGDVETLLPLETEPKNLLTLHRGETSESGNSSQEGLICASMSSNGKWIIFGTDAALRIFNFTYVSSSSAKKFIEGRSAARKKKNGYEFIL